MNQKNNTQVKKVLQILPPITGFLLTTLIIETITPIILFGKSFSGRSFQIQMLLFLTIWMVITILIYTMVSIKNNYFYNKVYQAIEFINVNFSERKLNKKVLTILELFFLFIFLIIILFPLSPIYQPFSQRDSGVFLYTGWRILNNEVPYKDIWDHKPPVIFYINALGLALSNNSRWGVWFIEILFLFTASIIGFYLLKRNFGMFSAILGTFLWLSQLFFVVDGGNKATGYTLPMQFAGLYLFYLGRKEKIKFWHFFFIGILGGIAFLTKQTTIGIWMAIVLYQIFDGIKNKKILKRLTEVLFIILGVLVVIVFVSYIFFQNNALNEYWESAFKYNFAYISGNRSVADQFLSFFDLSIINQTGIVSFSLLGAVIFIFFKKENNFQSPANDLLSVVMIALPFELLMINLPGFTHNHYYMVLLPVLSVLSGFFFNIIYAWINNKTRFSTFSYACFIIAILFTLGIGSIKEYNDIRIGLKLRINEPIIEFVRKNTQPDDYILVWGAETMVNFFSQRRSPTRFVYQYPLLNEIFASEEMIIEFLDDIIENKPKYIFDSMREDYPIFIFPIQSREIDRRLEYIETSYQFAGTINYWTKYEITSSEK